MKNYILTLFLILLFSCGGDLKKDSNLSQKKKNISNKDSQTSAEGGGYGFEKIANGLGFDTYEWSEKVDKTFFGDPKAVKGGNLNYIHSLFPRTMRVLGQNSSQVLNSRTIMSLCYEGLLGQHPATLVR